MRRRQGANLRNAPSVKARSALRRNKVKGR
jgi:hypothetical protein